MPVTTQTFLKYIYIYQNLRFRSDILMICDLLSYGTAQFKLDRTHMQHGLDMTRFHFTRVQACVYTLD